MNANDLTAHSVSSTPGMHLPLKPGKTSHRQRSMVPPRTHKRSEPYVIINNKPPIFEYNNGLNTSKDPADVQKTSYSFYKATTSKEHEFFGDTDSIDEAIFTQP
jgi:hypothetical protein